MATARAEVRDQDVGQFLQPLGLVPHPGLGAGVEHVQREGTERLHGRARAQLVDDGQRRDFPERGVHPRAGEGQLILSVAPLQMIFGQPKILQPSEEFGMEYLLAAIEGVAAQPDHLLLGEAQRAGMIELLAQFPFVDLVGEADRAAVDEREGGVNPGIHAPDHLQHQQLVEIRVEQAAYDRIELPGMIVNPPRYVGPGHAVPPSFSATPACATGLIASISPKRCLLRPWHRKNRTALSRGQRGAAPRRRIPMRPLASGSPRPSASIFSANSQSMKTRTIGADFISLRQTT